METRVPLNDNEKHRLILRLIAKLRCLDCGQFYDPHDLAVLQRGQDVWVFSARCGRCHKLTHIVVFMHLNADVEPVGDLTPEELEISDQWPPITSDDVLDVHELLEHFDGDLAALIAD
jgi:hypothetical protein